jgi:hypothetical protein
MDPNVRTVLNAVANLQTGWQRENKHFGKQSKHVKAATYTKKKKEVAM